MSFRLENPRLMVGFLFVTALLLGALLEYDSRVLSDALTTGVRAGLDYCLTGAEREF